MSQLFKKFNFGMVIPLLSLINAITIIIFIGLYN